jgi:diguanylate cyclase (GGDEF)-like protein
VAESAHPVPEREQERLRELDLLNIMDSLPERSYDGFAKLAAIICETPIALISLLDGSRQWFKANVGLDATETPRDQAFCAHTIIDPGTVMVVNDAAADERFVDNPLVKGDPNIRFYAGAALVTASGLALGALCVIDREPRELSARQLEALETLASEVSMMLQLRRTVGELERTVLDQDAEVDRLVGYQRELEQVEVELRAAASTDPVSGLANRRSLDTRLSEEVARAVRYRAPLAVLMVDLDGFKEHNDAFGHVAGDEAIRHAADVLSAALRPHDFLGRYGGDEFTVILPHTSSIGARVLAERLRREVSMAAWRERDFTVSIGYAVLGEGTSTLEELLTAADAALYRAKRAGRNCVRGPVALDG